MLTICGIPGTGHDSSTVNNNVAEWYKKKDYLDCWKIVPATVEKPCWQLLNNYVEQLWQPLLNNYESNWWKTVPVFFKTIKLEILEQLCLVQLLLNNHLLLKNRTRQCLTILPATVEQLCQHLLNNCNCVTEC